MSAVGPKNWATSEITWGIWNIPESEVLGFGPKFDFRGKEAVELGCGTAYFSAWLAKLGARPTGIDVTAVQLDIAQKLQKEHGIEFPLVEGNAEQIPFSDESFDIVVSEYGASIWCDTFKWVSEASRVLRPGGILVFLRNSTLQSLCVPDRGAIDNTLKRPLFGMHRIEWDDGEKSVEFHLPAGQLIALLRSHNFEIEHLYEIQAPADAPPLTFEYMDTEWAKKWPSEEVWRARKKA